MTTERHPQYITDEAGKRVSVILSMLDRSDRLGRRVDRVTDNALHLQIREQVFNEAVPL